MVSVYPSLKHISVFQSLDKDRLNSCGKAHILKERSRAFRQLQKIHLKAVWCPGYIPVCTLKPGSLQTGECVPCLLGTALTGHRAEVTDCLLFCRNQGSLISMTGGLVGLHVTGLISCR